MTGAHDPTGAEGGPSPAPSPAGAHPAPPERPGPSAPHLAYPPPGYPSGPYPAAPPLSAPPFTAPPLSAPPFAAAVPATAAPARRGPLAIVAFGLIVLLLIVVAAQTFVLIRLDNRLDRTVASTTRADGNSNGRIRGLEGRVVELERQAGKSLDAAAVAAQVSPSVFRVIAGDSSGTAFAIGREPSGGGTDLLTNFHVVESLYNSGGRDVALERDNKRYSAKIVKVGDGGKDIALLHTTEKFSRLQPSKATIASGQPVVVIGAPLGLEDTVTTGVVSALRTTADGPVIQFSAPINPGNSGGPVVDAQKQVVGIATAKASRAEGIGLAIPISIACDTFAVC
ncbi:S1C family serine protease [Planosporangium mesophilum]|nr:trypsin-like peptidase domain-containing protein [Planosporangium mesophilum]